MSKRSHLAEGDGMRGGGKRRKEEHGRGESEEVDVVMSEPTIGGGEGSGRSPLSVKEQGLRLWQTVKDAVNKEGKELSGVFLRKPSKRQYPDYYNIIQRPIALDDIKKQLDGNGYDSLEAVKADFDLCFGNAKQYNMKDSEIWKDAKDLLKIIHKAYNKMVPPVDHGENGVDGEGRKGKSKGPNLTRLIKARLQKLVDKTDDSGRMLSTEFMELPSKRDWPGYYKQIKKPQCLEAIFKHVKRKEYPTSAEFAADVELVFANAMDFNLEHTGIWEDAKTLRDYFRVLMSDLPPPFAVPAYAKPTNGKLKIKMPAAQPAVHATTIPVLSPPNQTPSSSLLLRVPVSNAHPVQSPVPATTTVPTPITTPATAPPPTPAPKTKPPRLVPPVVPQTSRQPTPQAPRPQPATTLATALTPQPTIAYINATYSHYPNASYVPSAAGATPSTSTTPNLPTTKAIPGASSLASMRSQSTSESPAPSAPMYSPRHQLKTVLLHTNRGRQILLDHREGVKTWAMRLAAGESALNVGSVTFVGDEEEEESSGGEEEEHEVNVEEEEEEEEEEAVAVMEVEEVTVKKRGKGKGKGRAAKGAAAKLNAAKARAAKAVKRKEMSSIKFGEVQVKLNGVVQAGKEEEKGRWTIVIPLGPSVLQVGESGGLVWKVYLDRIG